MTLPEMKLFFRSVRSLVPFVNWKVRWILFLDFMDFVLIYTKQKWEFCQVKFMFSFLSYESDVAGTSMTPKLTKLSVAFFVPPEKLCPPANQKPLPGNNKKKSSPFTIVYFQSKLDYERYNQGKAFAASAPLTGIKRRAQSFWKNFSDRMEVWNPLLKSTIASHYHRWILSVQTITIFLTFSIF